MLDVVCALVWEKQRERGVHQRADLVTGAGTGAAQERLQFGEGQFDGIEVGTVGWKKAQMRPGMLDGLSNLRLFVDREIIEDHDIAAPQCRDEHLLHVGAEGDGIDRAIEHGRRGECCGAQRCDHGVRLPVAAWRVIRRARAPRAPRKAPQQIRGDTRLVHKDVVAGIMKRHHLAPLPPRGGDVRAPLFAGVYRFF